MGTRTHDVFVADGCIIGPASNYQGYIYDVAANECRPTNDRMRARWAAICDFFPDLVMGKTVLDIGAHQGFFCFKALEHGATAVIGIESNENFYRPVADALTILPVSKLEWIKARWPATDHQADVVVLLSTIHHLYPVMSLLEIVAALERSTGQIAIVDFPDEHDANVEQQGHDPIEYNLTVFDGLVRINFQAISIKTGYNPTRHLYILRKGAENE